MHQELVIYFNKFPVSMLVHSYQFVDCGDFFLWKGILLHTLQTIISFYRSDRLLLFHSHLFPRQMSY